MRTKLVRCPQCGTKNRIPSVAQGTPTCGKCERRLPWLTEASDSDFAEVVEQSTVPVLVDMWANWCQPCRAVGRSLEHIAADLAGKVKVVKLDVDEAHETAARFGIQSIPTLLLIHDGNVRARHIGAAPEPELRRWIEEALPRAQPSASPRPSCDARAGSRRGPWASSP